MNIQRMFLIAPLQITLRSRLCNWIQHQRGARPSIRIAEEKFELKLNVRAFSKEELKVKARREYVVIEGKQQKQTKKGFVLRQFVRKFKLPNGCSPHTVQVNLSQEGVLTVTAPRTTCDINLPCEAMIPITTEAKTNQESMAAIQHQNHEKSK